MISEGIENNQWHKMGWFLHISSYLVQMRENADQKIPNTALGLQHY